MGGETGTHVSIMCRYLWALGTDLPCGVRAAGSSVAFSPGNLSTSSSASSTLGSPESEEYILSFETIDKMRRVSSYSALNSLIGERPALPSSQHSIRPPPHTHTHTQHGQRQVDSCQNCLAGKVIGVFWCQQCDSLGHFDSDLMAFDRLASCAVWEAAGTFHQSLLC